MHEAAGAEREVGRRQTKSMATHFHAHAHNARPYRFVSCGGIAILHWPSHMLADLGLIWLAFNLKHTEIAIRF